MTTLPDANTLPKGGSDYYYFSDLPETMISVIPGLSPDALLNASVRITAFDLLAQNTQTARFTWNISYDGTFPLTEELALKKTDDVGSVWQMVNTNTVSSETNSSTGMAIISDLAPGPCTARIEVTTEDAGYDTDTVTLLTGDTQQFYIRLG